MEGSVYVELKGGKFNEDGMSGRNYFVVVNFADQSKRSDTETIWVDSYKFSWNNEEFDFSVAEALDDDSGIAFELVYEENNEDILVGKTTVSKIKYYTDGVPERLCLMLENDGIVGDLNVSVCLHGCGVPPSPSTRDFGGEARAEPAVVRDRSFNFGFGGDGGGESAPTECDDSAPTECDDSAPTECDDSALHQVGELADEHAGEYKDALSKLRAAFAVVTQKFKKDFKDKVGRNPTPREIRSFFKLARGGSE